MGTSSGATSRGQAAIVEALRVFAASGTRHTPWMPAGALARAVGLADEHDPRFQADVQALYEAGVVRLMSGGGASGRNFYEAMLVPRA
ncbi:MAG TPA: hypothetical protein VHN78_06160 [Chloroflexota bacterium]|nr:hypothetical protein [Chloroflexota bacterium]